MGDQCPPLEPITEEEAALLVEYGVKGPYDELLGFPAASNCVFSNGRRDIFLTGTGYDDNNDGDSNPGIANARACQHVDSTWPLECLLLHHTNLISFTTATPLWDGVNGVLTDATKTVSCTSSRNALSVEGSDVVVGAAASASIEKEEGVVEAKGASLTTNFNQHEGSDAELLATIDEVLQEADKVLAKRVRHVDPMTEIYLLERQRGAEEEERRWSPIHCDNTTCTALRRSDSDSEDEGEIKDENGETDVKRLFAYEFGPTAEEQLVLREWDAVVLQCEQQLEIALSNPAGSEFAGAGGVDEMNTAAEAFVLPPLRVAEVHDAVSTRVTTHLSWMSQKGKILESIAMMEAKDSELQTAASQLLEEARKERSHPRRAPHGQIEFEPFLTRVNQLLPPNEMEVKLEAADLLSLGGEVETASAASGDQTPVAAAKGLSEMLAVEQIQRRAQREGFRMRCETHEAWCMQEEERKTACLLRWCEEETKRIQDEMQRCLLEASNMFECLLVEECSAYQELSNLERQHTLESKQRECFRLQEVRSQRVCELLKEHASGRHEIMAMEEEAAMKLTQEAEELSRELLRCQEQEGTAHVITTLQCWNLAEWEDKYSTHEELTKEVALQTTAESWRRLQSCVSIPTSQADMSPLPVSNVLRLRSLRREQTLRGKWIHECIQNISNATSALEECAHGLDEKTVHPPRPGIRLGNSVPATLSTVQTDASHSALDNNVVCLNAKLAKQVQPIIFGGVKRNLREAAQLCHTLSFALEQIASVDFASLSTLEVCTTGGVGDGGEKHMTPVAPLVHELDLGGNALPTLPLDDLLRVFPSIRRLSLSDNGLKNLTCRTASMRGVSDAQTHSLAQASHLLYLDVSMNELKNVEAIGKLFAYQLRSLVLYSNHIDSLLPLAPCTHLETLEASRNRISSLSELQSFALLQTLDLSENCLVTWDALTQHVLLQNLYLSRNHIGLLPKNLSLSFLRQLFMNENQLETLPSECFRWLPFLSVLHLENNKLRDVSGLAHCPRLTTVGLSFNQLQQVEDLSPLAACKKLQILYVSENPFTSEKDDNSSEALAKVRLTLIAWFPQLSELNNEEVSEEDHKIALSVETMWITPFSMARCLRRQVHESALCDAWHWPCGSTVEDVQQTCGTMEFYSQYMDSKGVYAAMFAALTSDLALTTLQREQEVLATVRRRRHHDALHVEEALERRMRESKRRLNPAVHRLSDEIDERNRREAKTTLRQHLKYLQTMPNIVANAHVRSILYHERMQAHQEAKAKVVICEWARLRLLGRQAKRELAALKAAYAESQRRRYEAAARVIQPVWRGAALRSRFKRILHDDADDEEEFTHVSLDFVDDSKATDGEDSVGAVLQRVLQSHGALPNFPIQSSSLRVPNVEGVLDGYVPPRASSAVPNGMVPLTENDRRRPESQPQGGTTLLSQQRVQPQRGEGVEESQGPSSLSSPVRVDEGWGALVSSQISKRQKKMERVQREHLRREFMKDPLKVKRALGGG
ncbi:hypothetical protein TraAM80_01990 [Trypanosoma rangeli]|uniref:Leucine-rich repeat protein (LRRP) n=1 Tax=Trypanosoma rangeli TaxID=5698 RepID=A0A422NW38_TRYRA|nr:uncharacterized protein TraAM80_01990 [Trypanosoma rangeli]RNF09722.1 hypothetical protein TraAM80_01990 [Trypanosoma rangeli]|eukprot:RNF09722.1 hypothetical protein TraAM80_01990 [Trypanosoma rangeli]